MRVVLSFVEPLYCVHFSGVEMMAAMNGIADYLIKRNRIWKKGVRSKHFGFRVSCKGSVFIVHWTYDTESLVAMNIGYEFSLNMSFPLSSLDMRIHIMEFRKDMI